MFKRYARYGTTEVANAARLAAYAANGIAPQGVNVTDCSDCGDIAEAVGDAEYDSPLLDDAPWMDQGNPDSADFGGVMILDMSGVDDSPVTAEVTDRLGSGGIVGARRARPKAMKVSALAVGRTPAGLHAGLSWLGAALHPPCSGGDCGGDTLHMFSACPPACGGQTDPDAAPVPVIYDQPALFTSTTYTPQPITNMALNPSYELGSGTTLTNWRADTLSGFGTAAAAIGRVSTGPFGTPPDRTYVARLTLASGANQSLTQTMTGLTIGRRYTVHGRCWIPTAANTGVKIAVHGSPDGTSATVTVRDGWVYVSHTFTASATSHDWGWLTSSATPTAGQFLYFDAMMFVEGGGIRGSGFSFGTGVEGWVGTDSVDTTFTGPASIAVVSGELVLTWQDNLDVGDVRHAAYGIVNNTTPGEVYTITFTVTVPTGSPDVQPHILFHNQGQGPVITTKDTPVPVRLTYVAQSTFTRFGVQVIGDPAGAGTTARIDNVRAVRFVDPLPYFDGATPDTTAAGTTLTDHTYDWLAGAETASTVTPGDSGFLTATGGGSNTITGPVLPGVCDLLTMEWNVTSSAGEAVQVIPGMAAPTGVVLVSGDPVLIDGDGTVVTLEVPQSADFPEAWRPVLVVPSGHPVFVTSLTVTHRPILTLEQCVGPYRRTLQNVVTIEGPVVVEEFTVGQDGEAVMAKVEWTWVAATPWVYADPTPILTSVDGRGSSPAVYSAPGVQLSVAAGVTAAATACPLPAPTLLTCADNNCCTPLQSPPSAPVFADPCLMVPSGYSRRTFQIPPTVTPAGLGVLSWTFINDSQPKMGVRVRVWDDPDPDFGIGEDRQCQWVQEFTIDYLAGGQSLTIDGRTETVMALCGLDAYNNPIVVDSLRNVSGPYGGPFSFAPIGCGRRYHIAVDIPTTYTSTCVGQYTSGDSQGGIVWSATLTRRD